MKINFNQLDRGYQKYKKEYDQAAISTLESGWYIMGNSGLKFEQEFARFIGSTYCAGLNSGLDALILAFRALGIGEGDEVIVPANTYIASVLAITENGATPIFVEPDEFYNLDVDKIEEKITPKTKAVLVVHLYGQAANMAKIKRITDKYNLYLVEDCAQSHGAKQGNKTTGCWGDIGCFSFYPTKNIGAFGDSGAIVTNNKEIYEKVKLLRNYGSKEKYRNRILGVNSRMDEIQAALLLVKLSHYDELKTERAEIANRYLNEINNKSLKLPTIRNGSDHVWHLFVISVEAKTEFRRYLERNGIATQSHYPQPPHLSEAYDYLGYKLGDYPTTEYYANTVLSLPLYEGMTTEEVDHVIDTINKFKENPLLKPRLIPKYENNTSMFKIDSITEMCKENKYKRLVVEQEKMGEVYISQYYGYEEPAELKKVILPEIYVAEMLDVSIIGGYSFILQDESVFVDDIYANDPEGRCDFTFGPIRSVNTGIATINYEESYREIEEAIFLIGSASFNYYHLTVEILSRLQYIDQFESYRNIPILVDEVVMRVKQYKELLDAANIYNHPIIIIHCYHRYFVKKLIYPSYNTWMPLNVTKGELYKYGDFKVAKSALNYLPNTIRNEMVPRVKKIFLSRKNTNNQRLVNTSEVQALFTKYGFETVYTEELSFAEQVSLFGSAKYIAGVSGAAFTNILYCMEDTNIICIFPKASEFHLYSTIANILKLNCIFLDADIVDNTGRISSDRFILNLEYCERFLSEME